MTIHYDYTDLVQAAQNGDAAPLVEQCTPYLIAILKPTLPYQDVDDMVQESLHLMLRKLSQLEDHSRFVSWLGTLADNVSRNYWRCRYRNNTESLPERTDGIKCCQDTRLPDQAVIEDEERELLAKAMGRLTPDKFEAVELFYVHGLSSIEISDKMGRNHNTVRRWLREARQELKDQL